jgi:phosphate transport system substrate-binding protein
MYKILLPLVLLFNISNSFARDQINIVGSSTVYPFVTVVAEKFGYRKEFKTPIVESTGTGGGLKLFCSGVGDNTPDFANASRQIKASEISLCKKNGVKKIQEIKIGYDGIVIANSKSSQTYNLKTEQIFLALARKVPSKGKLVDNFYKSWNQIDSRLPNQEIEVYGPPPTSGTRDAFVEIVMENACKKFPEFAANIKDEQIRKKKCHLLREDGAFVEMGENDNIIVQKLIANKDALGIFGYSFLEENLGRVKGAAVNSVEPSFENIADGSYPVSRSLYIYAKGDHFSSITGMQEFIAELTSERAGGQDGYLSFKGLIPLKAGEKKTRVVQ